MLGLLLQTNPAVADSLDAEGAEVVEVTLLDLVLKGGWAMLPLALLLILGIYIFFERYFTIKKANLNPEQFLKQVREYVRSGDVQRASLLCESTNSPYARLIGKGLSRLGYPLTDISASIENEGKLEVNRLEKSLTILGTIAGAAPMIGFLGTVTGMIAAFMKIAQFEGNINPALLADGIYQAMITTATGLIVGIPAYVGYNILTSMISNVIAKMEIASTEFIDLLQEPA